jgi:hypothetical protein
MSIGNTILTRDLVRLAEQGATQLPGRVSHDPNLLEEAAFQERHGMSRAAFAERQRLLAREAFELESTADIEGDPPLCEAPAGLTAKRTAYFRYHAWLRGEEQALATLENKRRDLQAIIDAPAATEGALRQMLRRTADVLLGKDSEQSDATAWAALESKRTEQAHKAEAARLALSDIEGQIQIAALRVDRLREREKQYLNPVLCELGEQIAQRLAQRRAEVQALERLLAPLYGSYGGYSRTTIEPPHVEIGWRHSWHDIADTLRSDAAADIGKMLPAIKF